MDWIPVIINPSAGHKTPILADLNQVFKDAGIRWSVEITQEEGDGVLLAQKLVQQGARIVAVHGGDGTISEVATGLSGSAAALAVLPGGTGNVLAQEFGIPRNYKAAAQLLTSEYDHRVVDVGVLGDRKFLLRAGAGLEAVALEKTPQQLKNHLGIMAYGIGGLQALVKTQPTRYLLQLDDQTLETEGLVCTVANAGHLGLPGLRLSRKIDIQDGKLDVFVLRRMDIQTILHFMSENFAHTLGLKEIEHWQVSRVQIQADPLQSIQIDGDQSGQTPVEIHCLPGSLKVIVPK
jgi:YegS/Rv2252/BmrU family lipid kinase